MGAAMGINRSDGVETRRKLLDAAAALFAAKGFHDAKTADICQAAGANAAAVNYHFGGKEKLYAESWRHIFERSIELYPPDGGVPVSASPEERLHGQIVALMRRLMDPATLDFDIVQKEMANPTGLLREVMRLAIEPLRQMVDGVVAELMGPLADRQQVQLCAGSVHAQCFSTLMHQRHRETAPHDMPVVGVDTMAEHIYRFSLAGIRAERQFLEKQQ